MDFQTAIFFVQTILLVVFMYIGIFKGIKAFNFLAVGILASMLPSIKDNTGFLVVGILLILFLIIDVFMGVAE